MRVTWECVPRIDFFLSTLARFVSVREPSTMSTSYVDGFENVGREEQEKKITELARSGQLVTAIAVARRLYGCDLKQARDLVESLRGSERRSA